MQAATVIHAVLSALTFEVGIAFPLISLIVELFMSSISDTLTSIADYSHPLQLCSLSAYSVFALDKQKFTVLRLRQTLIVVFAQCVPIFVRIGLGQNLDPRRWGLLRVDTALRPPILTNLRIYGIQLLSSSMVALMLASQLSNAIALNKDYYHGGASSSSPSSESPTTQGPGALDESSLTGAELAQQLKARTWMAARRAACAAARAALTSSGGGGGAASGGGGGADDYSSLVASGTYADGTAFEAECSEFYGGGGAAATASAADDFATKHSWWHDEFVLLAALAAVVADTVSLLNFLLVEYGRRLSRPQFTPLVCPLFFTHTFASRFVSKSL
jgi:hypothetical protein